MTIQEVLHKWKFCPEYTVYASPNNFHEIHVGLEGDWQHWEVPYRTDDEPKGEGWGAESLEQYINTHLK